MTKFLASVRSLAEAEIALAAGADILDLKEPSAGALGAVAHDVARAVVRRVRGRVLISATVGDLQDDPAEVAAAVTRMAATGVDFIKVGIFESRERAALLSSLAPLARHGMRIVAVLFADREPQLDVRDIRAAGLCGAMLDTASKQSGSLRQLLPTSQLQRFVEDCRSHKLLSGLAGSLREADAPPLLTLSPDYLGFRGALCGGQAREQSLSDAHLAAIRAAIPREIPAYTEGRVPRMAAGGY